VLGNIAAQNRSRASIRRRALLAPATTMSDILVAATAERGGLRARSTEIVRLTRERAIPSWRMAKGQDLLRWPHGATTAACAYTTVISRTQLELLSVRHPRIANSDAIADQICRFTRKGAFDVCTLFSRSNL